MPKAFSEREKDVIGKRLLEQGEKLFAAYGLRKTNVEEIAQAAGISKGAFYHFYESKEELFMDVMEQIEIRFRQEILAAIDMPGLSARARLFNILKKAFSLVEAMPILHVQPGSDYDLLFRRVPAEKLQEHLVSDLAFLEQLVARCRSAGIPIKASTEEIIGLMYPFVLAVLHEDELGPLSRSSNLDVLLELVVAFCLGEVELELQSERKQE